MSVYDVEGRPLLLFESRWTRQRIEQNNEDWELWRSTVRSQQKVGRVSMGSTRRSLLKKGLVGGGLLAVSGIGLSLQPGQDIPVPPQGLKF